MEEEPVKAKWGLAIGAALSALALAACGSSGGGNARRTATTELFTTAGFQKAYDAVKEKAGEKRRRCRSRSPRAAPTSSCASGEQATGFVYTGGDLHDEQVDVIGPGSLERPGLPLLRDRSRGDRQDRLRRQGEGRRQRPEGDRDDAREERRRRPAEVDDQRRGRRPHRPGLQRRARRLERDLAARRHRGVGTGSGLPATTGSSATDTSASEGGVTTPSGKTPAEIAQCVQAGGHRRRQDPGLRAVALRHFSGDPASMGSCEYWS